ncbi:Nitrogen regulation protein NR(I) [Gemmata obscuriglobus]|uniref:DNA-binding transcriptional regulator NtrC n=1 Tax=Gemmata obscuriglobus TaxID=114 RepID=A0A2Z3H1H5_9BACT|nr:sigma-54 dependent transcriptional regulator [Gemmata obscuriglobus]AWM40619.1 Fis family transcriptional regulator [Gemmata obscuriglobus]QEG26119.1 Nitrogen regulation protein NR(I) [Gemmata obscuriglobus]VTS00640.1 response regulator with -like aaa-type and dna-binding domains : Response regulator with CheY-like receiver, AAA-type ATPase, and DNA-binding domains OS=Singulisphaera acidiphila (strain ATCC BAA-1392 / DSM 18658 / VKM B-2454 / MOB10) GN=Sinac_1278 PE=4 SV=1: Response_reg: Sigma
MPKLLVIDDEPIICHSFRRAFSGPDVEVLTAGSVAEGWAAVGRDRPDVIVTDLQLPDGTGLDLFEKVRAADPRRPVVVITAYGTMETTIEAMKRGAFDYLTKPVDLAQMSAVLGRAFEAARLMREPAALPTDPGEDRIIGRSPVMQEMCKLIGRIAPQDASVLILGESGTGKELVARAIYSHSKRADRPFLAINCAAIPDTLVESELFGHEQGAFTGAERQRVGKFEQCGDGTLLLDEIGDMPLAAQAKMLRLLQDQTFERVGGSQAIATRVRVLAATNQHPEKLIAEGKFRHDLYYRLKVVTIHVPALRDRREDIPELAHHFLFRYAREANRDVRGFVPEALDLLQRADWPGNVRQLQNCVRAAVYQTVGHVLAPADLPGLVAPGATPAGVPTAAGAAPFDLGGTIEAMLQDGAGDVHARVTSLVERELLTRALRRTHGHQAQASDLLGINRTTLRTKLRELGITLDKVVADAPAE